MANTIKELEAENEQLRDELDALHMRYLSQVSLWKSRCSELKEHLSKPIDEEELDEVLNKAEELRKSAEGRKLTGGWHWRKWAEWGYRKAWEDKQ